jgi:hypothetical protein
MTPSASEYVVVTQAHSAEKRSGRQVAASNDAVVLPGAVYPFLLVETPDLVFLQGIATVVVAAGHLCQHLLKSLFPDQQATSAVLSSAGRA